MEYEAMLSSHLQHTFFPGIKASETSYPNESTVQGSSHFSENQSKFSWMLQRQGICLNIWNPWAKLFAKTMLGLETHNLVV